jgi:UDP-N-acetylglucosamine acyltransferase
MDLSAGSSLAQGLNVVGMRRRRFTHQRLQLVREFYQLFHSSGIFAERLAAVQPMASADPAIAEILTFIAAGDKRPLCMAYNKSDRLQVE